MSQPKLEAPPPAPAPVADAREAVARLHAAEQGLDAELVELEASLPGLRDAAGESALRARLQGHEAPVNPAAVADAEARVTVTRAAIGRARQERALAIQAVYAAEAAVLLADAQAKLHEADARQPKTDALLAKLYEYEHVHYEPARPERPAVQPHAPPETRQAMLLGGRPEIVLVPTPRTELLRQEAQQLLQQAHALEAREPVTTGYVPDAPTVDALLAQASADPMVMAPPGEALRAWAQAQTQRLEERQARMGPQDPDARAVATWSLEWVGDTVRPQNSGWRLVAPPANRRRA